MTSLVPRLVVATYFEDAASAVLEAMFASVEAAIAESAYTSRARLLRGVVHLRPAGTYQRLFGLEHGTAAPVEGTGYMTSGSVWAWIEEHRCSVSIDVERGTLRSWLPDGPMERRDQADAASIPGNETREKMLGREATHVHVVPLRAPGGSVDGMITLEVSCRAALGKEFVWDACCEVLENLANVAGAFIAARALPLRPASEEITDEFLPVVGASTSHLISLLRAFAQRDDTILIAGPTGSGKSRLARWCHERSRRKAHPFVPLDLLGLSEELQLAELFGSKRGAYTGSVRDNPGAIGRAAKGTLFIDEIDKLSMRTQAGLLRFIEERTYRMYGDDSPTDRRADVRILVGTNADLPAAVRAVRFREDLYYRINVLPVRLPPLAERLDELPRWADYMLRRRHAEGGAAGTVRFEPDAMKLLEATSWPGNLRQLDNIVRRAHALLLAGHADEAEGAAPRDLVIRRSHVQRALTFDGDAEPHALFELLWRAARAFVVEAVRRRSSGEPLSLDWADTFRGFVLAAAFHETQGRDEAFTLLGQEQLLKNRNHHRTWRRELMRVRELIALLRGAVDLDLQSILDADDDGAADLDRRR